MKKLERLVKRSVCRADHERVCCRRIWVWRSGETCEPAWIATRTQAVSSRIVHPSCGVWIAKSVKSAILGKQCCMSVSIERQRVNLQVMCIIKARAIIIETIVLALHRTFDQFHIYIVICGSKRVRSNDALTMQVRRADAPTPRRRGDLRAHTCCEWQCRRVAATHGKPPATNVSGLMPRQCC